jgi:ABC-type branched-subunit amino acid transport system substrate-binding protein
VAVLAVVTTIAGLCAVGTPTAQAQTGPNPFAREDKFCVKHTPPPGRRNSSTPGVTPDRLLWAEGATDAKALARVGAQIVPTEEIVAGLVAEINEVCGGINGRKITLKHANNNPLNPDPVSMLSANCLKLTEDYKAMVILANTNLAPFIRCATAQHKAIVQVAAPGAYDTEDLRAAKGRLFSNYPPNDQVAATFIDFADKRSLLKGQKVVVLGIQTAGSTTAQDLTKQYIEPLKARGIDAYLEVVPCIGTSNCRGQVPAIVTRAKANGVDTIVTSHIMSNSTLGVLWKQMYEQNLRARITGPTSLTIHSDPQQISMVNEAGAAAARFVSDLGQTAYSPDEQNIVGAWRYGYKESTFAKTCLEVVNRRLKNNPAWSYTERFLTGSNYFGPTSVCKALRAVARATWSLGNTVTTERLAAALAKEPGDKLQVGIPEFRKAALYSLADSKPTKLAPIRLHFPCPITTSTTQSACHLPMDRPIRARTF